MALCRLPVCARPVRRSSTDATGGRARRLDDAAARGRRTICRAPLWRSRTTLRTRAKHRAPQNADPRATPRFGTARLRVLREPAASYQPAVLALHEPPTHERAAFVYTRR